MQVFSEEQVQIQGKVLFNHKHAKKHQETHEVKGSNERKAMEEDVRQVEEENETFESNIKQKTKELEIVRVKQPNTLEE